MRLIDELIGSCTPPEQAVNCLTVNEWNNQFRLIGTRLPQDLLELNKYYGSGFFESIQSPVNASFGYYCSAISAHAITRLSELRLAKLKKPKAFPVNLYFEPGGLLPIGWISTGVDVCLKIVGDNPDKWKISLLRATTNDVHHLDLSLLEFSKEVISGALHSPIFTKHIPTTKGYRFQTSQEFVQCWHA